MTPDASASTESILQRGRGVAAFVRKLSVRRQQPSYPRSQRRQRSSSRDSAAIKAPGYPVGEEVYRTEVLENTTSTPRPSRETNWRSEQHASTSVHKQIQAGSGIEAAPARWEDLFNVGFNKSAIVASSSRDIVGNAEGRMDADTGPARNGYERETLDTPKSRSFPSGVNIGEKGRSASHRSSRKLQRRSGRAPPSIDIGAAILRCVRGDPKAEEPPEAGSVPQLPIQPSSLGSKLFRSKTKEKELPPIPLYPEGGQRKMTNTKDREQVAEESEEIERLRRDLSDSHRQIVELRKRCEAQSKDLENSNNFFSAVDKSSDSDIIHALQKLNAEIQQNTMFMAEWFAEDLEFCDGDTKPTRERNFAVQRASQHIGQVLLKSLGTKASEDIPMLLQIAFQAYLTSALYHLVSSWASEPTHTAFIDGIYRRLRKVEAQAIAGHWRALARVHIVHNCVSDSGAHVRGVVAGLADILLAAGCTASQSDAISKVSSRFEEKIALLVELAGRLNSLFDDVISSDFEVFLVRPGEDFAEKKMEDTDEDQIGIQEGPVLCATHLGLTKWIPVGSLWEKGKKRKVMVLKAKVLLVSFLNAPG